MKDIQASVIVLTRNEEAALEECLRSVSRFEDIHVVDSNSTDLTTTIAKELGATVTDFTWDGRYPKKKQWALENCPTKFDVVLFLDADERATPHLVSEITEVLPEIQGGRFAAAEIPLLYTFQGRTLKHGQKVVKRALIDRRRCAFPPIDDLAVTTMWEVEGHYQPAADGPCVRLKSHIIHEDPDPLSTWIDRHNRYSDWEAYLAQHPITSAAVRALRSRQGQIFALLPFKSLTIFLYTYVFRRGILDGRAGLDYATAMAFYQWMIRAKRRELVRRSRGRGGS